MPGGDRDSDETQCCPLPTRGRGLFPERPSASCGSGKASGTSRWVYATARRRDDVIHGGIVRRAARLWHAMGRVGPQGSPTAGPS